MVREVRVWHALGRPNKFLFLLRQVSREARNATRFQPDAIISNFNVAEDVCARKFLLQALRRLVGVRRECADVDQRGNAFVHSCGCDDSSAVGMTDKNSWAADSSERSHNCCDVALECV